jgi:hypothetical protein
MTAVDAAAESDADEGGGDSADPAAPTVDGERRWYVAEALLALEVAGLASFAFARPVLDAFGRSPDTFVAREADSTTVALFGLVVALGPPVVLAMVGLAGRPLGATVRRWLHLALVVVVGGLAVWQLGQSATGYPPESQKLMIAGVVGGLVLGALRALSTSATTFLRFAAVASVMFLLQFLFLSPSSAMVLGGGPQLDDEVAAEVAASLGDDPPNVAMMVFDALPTTSLLDGTGHVDAATFPNFARLAATSDWYRNNTSVAAFTSQAVPTILTGRLHPAGERKGVPGNDDRNLFTLLGGSYEMHVREAITRMCPDDVCPRDTSPGLAPLLGDAVDLWTGAVGENTEFDLPGALGENRYDHAADWIDGQDLSGSRPQLVFYHTVLPHDPWYLSDTGEPYEAARELPTGTYGLGWTGSGVAVGYQRHLLQLQAADRLLGQMLDKLEADGILDDTLVVVTADHGEAFTPNTLLRGLTEENANNIMWTPLFVKAPGQTEPAVDDANVQAIDVVPTVAEMLGIELPWDVDGIPASTAADRRDDTKVSKPHDSNGLEPDDGEDLIEVVDTDERLAQVLAADPTPFDGPDSVWMRTAHGALFGREVDDLDVGDPRDEAIAVERLEDVEGSQRTDPLIEVVGDADLPPGAVVAYALNGTIAAVTTVEPGLEPGAGLVHGLLPPRLYADGDNELTAYLIEGEVGAEVLRPLEVRASD